MASAMSELERRMAQADLSLSSKSNKRYYDIVWTIEDFSTLMGNRLYNSEPIGTKQLSINLPGQSAPTVFNIVCCPRLIVNFQGRVGVGIFLEQPLSSSSVIGIELGHLDKDGTLVVWEEVKSEDSEMVFAWYRWHDKLEQLPNDQLIINARFCLSLDADEAFTKRVKSQQEQQKHQRVVNIYQDMVEQQYVDIAGNVLLVFEDGEQKCHTFPLAVR
jgi:hypothetical protein